MSLCSRMEYSGTDRPFNGTQNVRLYPGEDTTLETLLNAANAADKSANRFNYQSHPDGRLVISQRGDYVTYARGVAAEACKAFMREFAHSAADKYLLETVDTFLAPPRTR